MEVNRKVLAGATLGATILAAVAAILVWRRRKVAEARGHVPIGKGRWEDRQVEWEGWPGGFSIRP